MSLNNVLVLIIIITIIGVVAYLYYYYENENDTISSDIYNKKTEKNEKKKKVTFRKEIEYKTYPVPKSILKNKNQDNYLQPINNLSDTSSEQSEIFKKKENTENSEITENSENTESTERSLIDMDEIFDNCSEKTSNDWNDNFGSVLASDYEKSAINKKIKKEHDMYFKSMGMFSDYLSNNDNITEVRKIDPFDPKNQDELSGLTIGEIYDNQVSSNFIAKPKKIKHIDSSMTIYEDESVINGGMMEGSNIKGYDNINNIHESANFSNGFDV